MNLAEKARQKFADYKVDKITLFFLAVLMTSFLTHLSFRSSHFQECDSCSMYDYIYRFPASAVIYNENLYGQFKTQPEKLHANLKEDFKLALYYYKNYIIQAAVRVDEYLPRWLRSGLAASLAGILSFGPGVIAGLLSSPSTTMEGFLSLNMVVTIFLFHLSVLLAYFTCRRLKLAPGACLLAALFMLFSISLYSYGYHQSSTIWNIACGALMLWAAVFYWDKDSLKKYLSRIAWLTGVLVFFDYLVVFYWLPILAAVYILKRNELSEGGFIKKTSSVLKTQWPAIFLVALCGLLFFQPSQGYRGAASGLKEFLLYTYYIILNFFSLYNQNYLIDLSQFLFFSALLVVGIWIMAKQFKQEANAGGALFKYFVIFLFILFALACAARVLSFVPMRHILFLAPPLFILLAIGLDYLFKKFKINRIGFLLVAILIIIGFVSVGQRMAAAYDNVKYISVDKDVDQILIGDCSFNLLYRKWDKPAAFYHPELLLSGKTYLYISQTITFKSLEKYLASDNLQVVKLKEENMDSDVYFEAYHPLSLMYNRPNGRFITKFKVYPIK